MQAIAAAAAAAAGTSHLIVGSGRRESGYWGTMASPLIDENERAGERESEREAEEEKMRARVFVSQL